MSEEGEALDRLRARMEPDCGGFSWREETLASIAISAKRIADLMAAGVTDALGKSPAFNDPTMVMNRARILAGQLGEHDLARDLASAIAGVNARRKS